NLPDERANNLLGQAYFVRGLMYFELARFWGGIPGVYGQLGVVIRTTPSRGIGADSYGARASLTDTYAQVRTDLETALELLPEMRTDAADRGRAVKPTARALLSRLHLYLREYGPAEQYASAVLADGRYSLVRPYEAIFRTKNTAESVFEVQYAVNDVSGMRNWYYPALAGGRGGLALHEAFYQELTADPADERGRLTAYNANVKVYYPTKYSTPGNSDNTHVIRVAELYLNRAEARAQLGDLAGAAADLNAVRERAGLANTAATTRGELLDAILQERKLEFFQEGHRWFDLFRTGKALEVLVNLKRDTGSRPVSLTSPARQVFPFPTSEVLTNPNLEQNEAYR
ncbi:MAG: RagB/SusD family nutrient uptake outer membrane protein, partial [Cytophagales bacterium]|nr:RagB/SusD family nutrient uptake outer membrane protein [Cytophagales bacterium]